MSAGPNLLAWAKKIAASDFDADPDVFDLAVAILADEEERKRGFSVDLSAVAINENYKAMLDQLYGASITTKTPEPPSE